ncbi:hypothetical protein [Stakelama marina]|uniref:STAS/SEC14 domain-containing protein n=1 Tax=Stakelama marina TaxID=2826939 RepID=A0A8T4ID59_9SPHN|nr:hypothetical protein [Stakelama marina]MBR0552510.1 hypothetical protein [Stakelama marina]
MGAFDVSYDTRRCRLRIVVKGYLSPDEVRALASQLNRNIEKAGSDFDGIVESLEFPVQVNEVADLLGVLGRGVMTRTSGRAAIVVASMLNKMQVDRTLAHPRLRVFMTVAEAEQWLDTPTTEAT